MAVSHKVGLIKELPSTYIDICVSVCYDKIFLVLHPPFVEVI